MLRWIEEKLNFSLFFLLYRAIFVYYLRKKWKKSEEIEPASAEKREKLLEKTFSCFFFRRLMWCCCFVFLRLRFVLNFNTQSSSVGGSNLVRKSRERCVLCVRSMWGKNHRKTKSTDAIDSIFHHVDFNETQQRGWLDSSHSFFFADDRHSLNVHFYV